MLHGLPILYALFLWWFSTGVILYLDGLPQRTFRWSMGGATVLAAAAVYALTLTSGEASVGNAYAGFAIGLVVWGWLETGYYMGFMVGPRRRAAPGGSTDGAGSSTPSRRRCITNSPRSRWPPSSPP